jgi:hypothetical protein
VPEATKAIAPSAARLTISLRDIGYDFSTALADVVDNSIAAGATRIDVRVAFEGAGSRVVVVDDGHGMDELQLEEALRFGSRRKYTSSDLGKFGLGLKTASLSQGRRLTVISRCEGGLPHGLTLDLDHVERTDRWEVIVRSPDDLPPGLTDLLPSTSGTVVLWENLDRVLSYANPDGEWARRRLQGLAESAHDYLAMVFHRFLCSTGSAQPIKMTVNRSVTEPLGSDVLQPWDPYVTAEAAVREMPLAEYGLQAPSGAGTVTVSPYVLPPKEGFSSPAAFEAAAGPLKWNRQQGLYIYRSGRLIQAGGWSGLRTLDEHLKLARIAIDFDPVLDPLFQVNVAKMRVALPAELRNQMQSQIAAACHEADRVYREASIARNQDESEGERPAAGSTSSADELLLSLGSAALSLGGDEFDRLRRILDVALGAGLVAPVQRDSVLDLRTRDAEVL